MRNCACPCNFGLVGVPPRPPSHMRNVHSFITLFSNQEAPDAGRSGHFRNDHVLTIRHIGTDLKAALPISIADDSARGCSCSRVVRRRFTFLPSIFLHLALLDGGSVKRDLRQGMFHGPRIGEYVSTRLTDDFSLISSVPNSSYWIVMGVGIVSYVRLFPPSSQKL